MVVVGFLFCLVFIMLLRFLCNCLTSGSLKQQPLYLHPGQGDHFLEPREAVGLGAGGKLGGGRNHC